jgi:hypothetical protein
LLVFSSKLFGNEALKLEILMQLYKQALQLTAIEKRPDIPPKSGTRREAIKSGSSDSTHDHGDGDASEDREGEAEAVGVGGSRPEHRRRSFVGVQGDSTCKGELFGLENLLQFEVWKMKSIVRSIPCLQLVMSS